MSRSFSSPVNSQRERESVTGRVNKVNWKRGPSLCLAPLPLTPGSPTGDHCNRSRSCNRATVVLSLSSQGGRLLDPPPRTACQCQLAQSPVPVCLPACCAPGEIQLRAWVKSLANWQPSLSLSLCLSVSLCRLVVAFGWRPPACRLSNFLVSAEVYMSVRPCLFACLAVYAYTYHVWGRTRQQSALCSLSSHDSRSCRVIKSLSRGLMGLWLFLIYPVSSLLNVYNFQPVQPWLSYQLCMHLKCRVRSNRYFDNFEMGSF